MKKPSKKKRAKISDNEELKPLMLASISHLKKIWDTPEEEEVWSKYY